MKTQEIHVAFNCLDETTHLSRSSTIEGIQRPDQPHDIQLVRIIFEDGYMLQIDDEMTVIQKGEFKITYLNSEPTNLVIHGDCKSQEPAGYDGDVMDLLSQYKCPISATDLVMMRSARMKVIVHLKPIA
ncbi:hypothetical protein [Aeromonas veronii]|uniref:hypothetical protein n=1 Tax=Aeromonas veronii TaxID=654 RepID=UPI0032F0583F